MEPKKQMINLNPFFHLCILLVFAVNYERQDSNVKRQHSAGVVGIYVRTVHTHTHTHTHIYTALIHTCDMPRSTDLHFSILGTTHRHTIQTLTHSDTHTFIFKIRSRDKFSFLNSGSDEASNSSCMCIAQNICTQRKSEKF